MKKVLVISLIAIMSLSLISCGDNKKDIKETKDKPKVEEKISRVNDKHIAVLESDKAYEEMATDERIVASEIIDDFWNDLSAEEKDKYKDRRNFLKKNKEEAVSKWKKETEAKNATSPKTSSTPKPVNSEDNKETATVNKNSSNNGNSSSGITTNEPAPQGRTVYWTPKGKSYHYTKSCPTLARSKTINEGNSGACPKTDPCDKCVK